jgi:hypothetical protein
LRIEFKVDLLHQLRTFDKTDRRAVGELVEKVRTGFGQPHLHGGTGLRALGGDVYECRLNLRQRLVFTLRTGTLYFLFIGNHEDVKRFVKNQ